MQLHEFGIKDSNLCTFSKSAPETILHLFCLSPHVNNFWNDVSTWISSYFHRNIEIDNFNKLFVFEHYNTKLTTVLLNCFLLNVRYVIYRHKYDGFKSTLALNIRTIKNVQRTEYNIPKRNGKMNQHFLKWSHCM